MRFLLFVHISDIGGSIIRLKHRCKRMEVHRNYRSDSSTRKVCDLIRISGILIIRFKVMPFFIENYFHFIERTPHFLRPIGKRRPRVFRSTVKIERNDE